MPSSPDNEGAAVVKMAREYLGTPFKHQGRLKGVGIDCIGVVMDIAHRRGLTDYDRTNYTRETVPGELEAALDFLFVRVRRQPRAADIVLFEDPETGRAHVGIWTGSGMIHARAGRDVREHRVDRAMRKKIKGVYQWATSDG